MAAPTITALPRYPNPADPPATFHAAAYAWTIALSDTTVGEINTATAWIETTAAEVDADRLAAETARTGAETAETGAVAARTAAEIAAASAGYVGLWSDLTGALSAGDQVYHERAYWLALTAITDVTASEPSPSNTDWIALISADVLSFTNLLIQG